MVDPRQEQSRPVTAQASPVPRPRKARPSVRPSRLMIGAGTVAALTVIGSGLVRFPAPAVTDAGAVTTQSRTASAQSATKRSATARSATKRSATAKRPISYVRLKPGQRAPKGAKVIQEAAPTPRVVVRRVAAAPQVSRVHVVARTRQSG
jgi:hypothetical protein